LRRTLVALFTIALVGCGDARPPLQGGGVSVNPGGGGGPVTTDAAVPDADGEEAAIVDGYPAAPYGQYAGNTFPAYSLDGYADASTTWAKVDMRDYFDPDGTKGVRALVVVTAAQWCGVCQQEARWVPGEYTKSWQARGARLVTALIQDGSYKPAVRLVADQWRDAYSIPYAVVIDPTMSLIPPDIGAVKLPYTYVIDPRTMKIAHVYSAAIAPPTIPALDTVLARNGG